MSEQSVNIEEKVENRVVRCFYYMLPILIPHGMKLFAKQLKLVPLSKDIR